MLSIGAFIHMPKEFHPEIFEPAISPFLGILNDFTLSPQLNVLITLFITIVQALALNRIVSNYNLLGQPSFLPALMYVTTASLILPFLALSATLICNVLLIWLIHKLLKIYHNKEVQSTLFDLGMIVALGSLFYFPFIAFFPVLWIALIIYRPFNWREWAAGLIGFATIYFWLGIVYFWLDRLPDFYAIWRPLKKPFTASFPIERNDYWVLLPVAVILVLFFDALRKNFFKSIVFARKSFQLLFFILVLGVASFYLKPDFQDYHFLICAPPLSIYMAYYFSFAKVRWFYESLYAILLIMILYFQLV